MQFSVEGNREGKERYLLQRGYKRTAFYEPAVFLRGTGQIPWTLRFLFSNLKREELCKMTTISSTNGTSFLHNARCNSTGFGESLYCFSKLRDRGMVKHL